MTAPPPPPPGPPGAPGPYSPYGPGYGGGWAPFAPPKPGVIPLGPLGVGDILGGAFSTLGRAWKALLGLSAAVFGIVAVLAGVLVFIAFTSMAEMFERTSSPAFGSRTTIVEDVTPLAVVGLVSLWVLAVLAFFLAYALITAAGPVALRSAVVGQQVTFGMLWRQTWARVGAVVGTILLTYLIALVPTGGLAFLGLFLIFGALSAASTGSGFEPPLWGIPVGLLGGLAVFVLAVWIWVKFILAPSAVVMEGLGPVQAMRRSSQLVRGSWWRVFGISLLGGVIASVMAWLIQMAFQLVGVLPAAALSGSGSDAQVPAIAVMVVVSALGVLLSQVVSSVYPSLVNGLIYVDRRIRTENLAASLAEAAGVPPHPQPYPYGQPPAPPYGQPPMG
ncbi:hypothetical protein I3F58_08495 [Streptomyces sp. MUM 203J]|uniref:DUF7847 domain-containing protein n=1 Tax=Streptomyces sp. MUM 203J TaxID=2791990 RepID=UPI001F03B260|nr:hypothetical protein [Streptomyces sp. MUM 203J]MCH0539606.1 hypothetical protein [Streptomyces sp. MUM 203J]